MVVERKTKQHLCLMGKYHVFSTYRVLLAVFKVTQVIRYRFFSIYQFSTALYLENNFDNFLS